MGKDKFKEQFASATAAAFQKVYASVYEQVGDGEIFHSDVVYELLEKPKDPKMGRFALPVFRFVKLLKDKPSAISSKVAEESNRLLEAEQPRLVRVSGVGGFLNAEVDFGVLASETLTQILMAGEAYGGSDIGKGKTVLVEYSSPNIAKPFGVGHLRTTILGNCLRLVFRKLGYEVVGINYPGDWGTQFGKMIVALKKWGSEKTLEGDNVGALVDLYVRFHREVEGDPALEDEARAAFKKLEEGDPDVTQLWEQLRRISHAEFDRVYGLLGVEFDRVIGESFLNDKMDAVVGRLEKAGLTRMSDGALIVELDDPNLPPALLRKADGATLYITRDLAGLVYRWNTYKFHESIYVVASAQADHFKQCLQVMDKLEQAEGIPSEERMTGKVKHIEFGWVKFEQKTMSTRKGNIVLLEDVINRAVELVRETIAQKNPDLDKIDETAHMVGVGAVIFSQLAVRRQKDISFIWKDVLNFDGETGPYLQYTYARLCSLIRNYPGTISPDVDYGLLDKEEEKRVIEYLADFPRAVNDAAGHYEPYYIVNHLIGLSGSFNTMYQRKTDNGKIDKIVSDNTDLSAARLALVKATQTVLGEGLRLLGIQSPTEM